MHDLKFVNIILTKSNFLVPLKSVIGRGTAVNEREINDDGHGNDDRVRQHMIRL